MDNASPLKTDVTITTAANQTSSSSIERDDIADEIKKDSSRTKQIKEQVEKVMDLEFEVTKLKSIADSLEELEKTYPQLDSLEEHENIDPLSSTR